MSSLTSGGSAVDRLVRHTRRLDAGLQVCGIGHPLRRKITARLLAAKAPRLRSGMAALFAEFLGEPAADALTLAADWLYYRSIARAGWLGESARADSRPGQRQARVLDEAALGAFLSGSMGTSRGILMASIHMGDYLRGLAALGQCLQGRRVVILRRRQASPGEGAAFAAFSRAGIRFDVLRHDRTTAFSALRALKRGAVVVVLYDLTRRWGRTAPVRLFGREVQMVCGPAELAMKAGADMLPVVTGFDEGGCLEIRAGRVLAGAAGKGRDIILQQLADFAEQAIRTRPAQWHHWPLLPEMLARFPSGDACIDPRADAGSDARKQAVV